MGVAKAPLCSDCLLTLAFIKAVAVAEEEEDAYNEWPHASP
jgi:hypothetical protein